MWIFPFFWMTRACAAREGRQRVRVLHCRSPHMQCVFSSSDIFDAMFPVTHIAGETVIQQGEFPASLSRAVGMGMGCGAWPVLWAWPWVVGVGMGHGLGMSKDSPALKKSPGALLVCRCLRDFPSAERAPETGQVGTAGAPPHMQPGDCERVAPPVHLTVPMWATPHVVCTSFI